MNQYEMEQKLNSMDTTTYFRFRTDVAQALVDAERGEGANNTAFNFALKDICARCKRFVEPPKKPVRCSACKSIIYCSAECATTHWTTPAVLGAPTHKMVCSSNKRHMERLPEVHAITKSFPWGKIEKDGTFESNIARARFGVLGESNFGYWSHRGAVGPPKLPENYAPYAIGIHIPPPSKDSYDSPTHLDGQDLFKKQHLTDEQGWRLAGNRSYIPFRNFSSPPETRPVLVTDFEGGVVDWDSWHKWRRIPKDSPAALLMYSPLSVYWLLTHVLRVTSPNAGSPTKRIPLNVHFQGVGVELNYLPLFSEIALLLPYHDIKLVMFGAGAEKLLSEAKKHPDSLAAKAISSNPQPVFTYEAPVENGSGSISIELRPAKWWTENEVATGKPKIDAIIGSNAGLLTYPEWQPVIYAALSRRIPFATTDFVEQSVELQRDMISTVYMRYVSPELLAEEAHPIALNPFHRPGQRDAPFWRYPNLYDGFTLVVYKEKAK